MRAASEAGVEMIACQMSMDFMGVKKEELFDFVTSAVWRHILRLLTTQSHICLSDGITAVLKKLQGFFRTVFSDITSNRPLCMHTLFQGDTVMCRYYLRCFALPGCWP
jgi:hypothetical protein